MKPPRVALDNVTAITPCLVRVHLLVDVEVGRAEETADLLRILLKAALGDGLPLDADPSVFDALAADVIAASERSIAEASRTASGQDDRVDGIRREAASIASALAALRRRCGALATVKP